MTGQSIDAARLLGRFRTLGDLCFQHLLHGIRDRIGLLMVRICFFGIPSPDRRQRRRASASSPLTGRRRSRPRGQSRPSAVDDFAELVLQIDIDRRRLTVIEIGRQGIDGSARALSSTSPARLAYIGLAERSRGQSMHSRW